MWRFPYSNHWISSTGNQPPFLGAPQSYLIIRAKGTLRLPSGLTTGNPKAFRRAFLVAWASLVAQRVKHLPAMHRLGLISGSKDPLEKEKATHSGTLAWKIPLTEKPGRLQSMESQRVGYDWATSLSLSLSRCSEGKESTCNAGDPGSISESRRSSWKREWLLTPDRGAWRAPVHRVPKNWTQLRN